MYCIKCGTKMENGACPNCGAVNQGTNGQQNAAPQGNPYAAPYGNPYYWMQNVSRFDLKGIIPKNAAGWIGCMKFFCWIKFAVTAVAFGFGGFFMETLLNSFRYYDGDGGFLTVGIITGIVIGIVGIAKDMIFMNIAENVGIIGKNIANVDK